jgi:hypothetical protein
MTIKSVLLASAALCTLSLAPALAASAPRVAVAAAHPGHAQVKTPMHAGKVGHLTSSIGVSTSVSVSADYKKKTMLPYTYYTYYDSGSFCNSSQKEKQVLATKKTKYAKLSTGVETLSGYCSTAPTKFYGDNYDLQSKKAKNKTDSFVSDLKGTKIHYNGNVYDINTNLNVSVHVGS